MIARAFKYATNPTDPAGFAAISTVFSISLNREFRGTSFRTRDKRSCSAFFTCYEISFHLVSFERLR